VLNLVKLNILGACADSEEIFYFPFAEVNYGGQVVRLAPGDPNRGLYPQIADEGTWSVSVPGEEVARHARQLILSGFLSCWRVSEDPGDRGPFLTPEEQVSGLYRGRVGITAPAEEELAAYRGYDCLTFGEHMEQFGYGPHEFRTTRAGIDELEKPVYEEFWGSL